MRPALLLLLLSALGLVQPLHARLAATLSAGGATDTRADRLPAILVKPGETSSPFLAPGPFEVTWTGKLVIPERLRLVFSFEGEGAATLLLDGKEALSESGVLGTAASERIRLNPGEHDLSITFKSKDDGSGRFRLFWEERSFPRQSVPPTAFKPASELQSAARLGRELFASNHCAKCHLPASGFGPSPMPEMLEIAPLLSASGTRLNEKWLAEWIAAPAALKPDTRMPALVDASAAEGRQAAADLAAWLMTMKIGEPAAAPDPALARTGGETFHRLGCVACHSRPDEIELKPGRIPLHNAAAKFQPGALVDFLKNPGQWYPHIGMPDFALSDEEAGSLAAYLLAASGKIEHKRAALPAGDATKGAALALQLNCGACHAGLPFAPASAPPLDAIFKADWAAAGCVHGGPDLPHLNLSEDEKAALVAFSKTGVEPLSRDVPAEYAARKMEALRCIACHEIDGRRPLLDSTHVETNDLVAHVAGENEKLAQSRPSLTYAGEMLHSSYISSMLDGKAQPRPRPWLDMRMPAFHAFAGPMAEGIARLHGVEPGAPEAPAADPALAAVGKSLSVGSDGFGCTTCHGVGKDKATAAFEVEGINFALVHQRLRREYFDRWMADPRSVTPDTKMPRYSENGESQRTDILDGDAAKQFEAIWNYLQAPAE